MQLYHGTSKEHLSSIKDSGVAEGSYWGTLEQAQHWAKSFGDDGLVLSADIETSYLAASMLMAEAMYENGDLNEMPDESDWKHSLEFLGGVICTESVFDFEIVD